MTKVKLKVYLDTSVLNRIFDDQTQARIYLESISMQLIFLLVENETIEIVSSDALVYETQRNPYSDRRTFVELVLQQARHFQLITEEVLARSQQIETSAKIKGVDALHIACAEAIEADYFIICDDQMIKKYSGTLAVKTPVEFVAIIFNAWIEKNYYDSSNRFDDSWDWGN